jgi:AcrR family transcriptional regulator
MTPSRRDRQREATLKEIKVVARRQMAAEGTAALSLRSIAAEMGLTAPALYRYYANRDELITALIVDAFNGLADAMAAGDEAAPTTDYTARVHGIVTAYRRWALDHRADFQLIYGNPIPGYIAPREVTVPAVVRGFVIICRALAEALEAGRLTINPDAQTIPAPVITHFEAMIAREGYSVPPVVLYLGIRGWTRLHGLIVLELYGHLGPSVGDADAFFAHEMSALLRDLGLPPPA